MLHLQVSSSMFAMGDDYTSSISPFDDLFLRRSPEFTDEIKVILPKDLNSGHHLLFTFVHVEFSPSRDTNESVLGYSVGSSFCSPRC